MKQRVGYKTPTNIWLSLIDYELPVWFMDYWEVENVLVRSDAGLGSGWEKVQTLCHFDNEDLPIINGETPWQFEDSSEELIDITHFMIIDV